MTFDELVVEIDEYLEKTAPDQLRVWKIRRGRFDAILNRFLDTMSFRPDTLGFSEEDRQREADMVNFVVDQINLFVCQECFASSKKVAQAKAANSRIAEIFARENKFFADEMQGSLVCQQ